MSLSSATAGARAAAVLLAVLAAGCSGGAVTGPTPAPTPGTPGTPAPATAPSAPATAAPEPGATGTPTATPAPTPTAEGLSELTAYLARDDGTRLWVEPVTFTLDEPTTGVARAAMGLVLAGPEPEREGLTRLTDPASTVVGAAIADGVLTVDLSAAVRAPSLGGPAEEALQQMIAHTGTQFDGIDTVQILVDGEVVETLWGHSDWSQPLEPDDLAISPIVIAEATVDSLEVTVSGTANTFEAHLDLRLLDATAAEVARTFTTATCGTGCRGDWSHTFPLPSAGTWTVEASAPDASGGEGPPPFVTTVTVTAR